MPFTAASSSHHASQKGERADAVELMAAVERFRAEAGGDTEGPVNVPRLGDGLLEGGEGEDRVGAAWAGNRL